MSSARPRTILHRLLGSFRLTRALRLVWEGSPSLTLVSVGLVILRSVLPLAVLYLTKLVIDAIAAGFQGEGVAFSHILLLIALTAAASLLGSLLGVLSGIVTESHSYLVTDRVLETIHRKSVVMDLRYYEDPAYHDTLHRAQREAPYRPSAVLGNLLLVAQSGLTAVGIVGLLATIHWLLAVCLFVAVVPTLWVRIRHADRFYRWQETRSQLQRKSHYVSWLMLNPGPSKEVRLFDLGGVLADRFRELRDRLRREQIDLSKSRSLEDSATQVVAALVIFGAFVYIAWRSYEGTLSIGDLVMYFGAVQRGQGSMQGLFGALASLYEDNLFLATMDDFMALEPEVVAPPDPRPVPSPIRQGIVFEGVWFRYPGSSRPVLSGIDLEIPAGEAVALVGSNGVGKSTLVKLLCRLYDPDEGRITMDGIDLREMDPEELRRRISVVFQDFFRYSASARDNIWFGDVDRPSADAGIVAAGETAGADRFLRELRHGYDTVLGPMFDDSEELSIGEWQKVALARAFFREAQLLVVDEPTSALDAVAEADLFEKLRALVRGRATLLISHRFSTVRMADRIYVVEGGRVLESGSHERLLALGGKYAALFRMQAAPYQERESDAPAR